MKRRALTSIFLFAALVVMMVGPGLAADKVKFGTSFKLSPSYYLPAMAAEERGFWKENRLEAEYLPFMGGGPLYAAVAAGEIKAGVSTTISQIHAASMGVPLLIVGELTSTQQFAIWVLSGSPLKEPKDIKGIKIGMVRAGSADHILARAAAKALGLEKDVRFVAVGGGMEKVAALKARAVEAISEGHTAIAHLWAAGEVRELVLVDNYLPREWVGNTFFAHREFARTSPDVMRRVLKAGLQSIKFIRENPTWAVEKMRAVSGYSEKVAKFTYDKLLTFTRDGKIDPRAIENVKNFLVEYELVPKEKAPATAEIFTTRFLE